MEIFRNLYELIDYKYDISDRFDSFIKWYKDSGTNRCIVYIAAAMLFLIFVFSFRACTAEPKPISNKIWAYNESDDRLYKLHKSKVDDSVIKATVYQTDDGERVIAWLVWDDKIRSVDGPWVPFDSDEARNIVDEFSNQYIGNIKAAIP